MRYVCLKCYKVYPKRETKCECGAVNLMRPEEYWSFEDKRKIKEKAD